MPFNGNIDGQRPWVNLILLSQMPRYLCTAMSPQTFTLVYFSIFHVYGLFHRLNKVTGLCSSPGAAYVVLLIHLANAIAKPWMPPVWNQGLVAVRVVMVAFSGPYCVASFSCLLSFPSISRALVIYLHRERSQGPYRISKKGIGIHAKDRSAGTDDAQCIPSASYIVGVNKGKTAPKTDLRTELAARLDAANTE